MSIIVTPDGFIIHKALRWPCALGRKGVGHKQLEGDGLTPIGTFELGRLFWRSDRVQQPATALPCVKITKNMGWCDDPDHTDYNQLINLPHPGRHEHMWRQDHLYDVVIEILYNTNPIKKNLGSALFIHVAKSNYLPTEGCIALKLKDLLELALDCSAQTTLTIST